MTDKTFERVAPEDVLQQFWAGNNAKGKKGFQSTAPATIGGPPSKGEIAAHTALGGASTFEAPSAGAKSRASADYAAGRPVYVAHAKEAGVKKGDVVVINGGGFGKVPWRVEGLGSREGHTYLKLGNSNEVAAVSGKQLGWGITAEKFATVQKSRGRVP